MSGEAGNVMGRRGPQPTARKLTSSDDRLMKGGQPRGIPEARAEGGSKKAGVWKTVHRTRLIQRVHKGNDRQTRLKGEDCG